MTCVLKLVILLNICGALYKLSLRSQASSLTLIPKNALIMKISCILSAVPFTSEEKLRKRIECDIGKQGSLSEVSSKRMMIPERDETFVSVSGGINTLKDMEVCCLRFVHSEEQFNAACLLVSSKDFIGSLKQQCCNIYQCFN